MKNAIKVFCFVVTVIIVGVSSVYLYFTWGVGDFKTIDGSEKGTVIITAYIGTDTDVVVPNRIRGKKVIAIDNSAFTETDITSVKIGDYVKSIGINAFQYCSKLKSVDMGKAVKSVGDAAFSQCPELSEVKFSPNLEKLGVVIFNNDPKLTTIDLNGNENFIFDNGIIYSADMTILYETLATADLSNYSCPDTVVDIRGMAFYAQDELKSINLNSGLKSIPEGLFIDCTGLTEITIPDTVVSMGALLFTGSAITTVKIPDSVQKIDDTAFTNVEEQVTIVTTKGSYAQKFAEQNELQVQIVESL